MTPLAAGRAMCALGIALAGCASAPERLARSLEFAAWTYDSDSSDSGLASRVTPQGGVGSQGLLETSGSGEGYGFGLTMSLDRLLGPETQPIRIERDDLREMRMELVRPLQAVVEPPAKKRRGWRSWTTASLGLVTVLTGIAEGVSRQRGGGGVVMPCARKIAEKLTGRGPAAG